MRYEVRWEDGLETVASQHDSEEGAKKKARWMSKDFRLAIVAGIEGEEGKETIVKKWTFENGKQTDSHLETVGLEGPAVEEGHQGRQPLPEYHDANGPVVENAPAETEEPKSAKSTKTRQAKAKKTDKKKEESVVTPSDTVEANTEDISKSDLDTNKESTTMSPKAERFAEQLGLKDGTVKKKMAAHLLGNMGKQVSLAQLGRAAYGSSWKMDSKGALFTAWGGLADTIKKKRVGLEAKKEKGDGKEMTFGLHVK